MSPSPAKTLADLTPYIVNDSVYTLNVHHPASDPVPDPEPEFFAVTKRDSGNHNDFDVSLPAKPALAIDSIHPSTGISSEHAGRVTIGIEDSTYTPRSQLAPDTLANLSSENSCGPTSSVPSTWDVSPEADANSSPPSLLPSRFGCINTESKLSHSGPMSSTSGSSDDVSRKDTTRSSTSSIARGLRRTNPDMRMFDQAKEANDSRKRRNSESTDEHPRPQTKLAYVPPNFNSPPVSEVLHGVEKASQQIQHTEEHVKKVNITSPTQRGIKDRRNLLPTEAQKLTLPMELSSLPGRCMPAAALVNLKDLSHPRPQSPSVHKVPLTCAAASSDSSPGFLPFTVTTISSGSSISHDGMPSPQSPQSPQARRTKDLRYTSRSLFGRNRNGTNDNSQPKANQTSLPSPISPNTTAMEEAQQIAKNTRRRWGGSKSFNTEPLTPDSPSPDSSSQRFSLSRFLNGRKHKRSSSGTSPAHTVCSDEPSIRGSTSFPQEAFLESLAHLSCPPDFVPPGLQRVPTPNPNNKDRDAKPNDFSFDSMGNLKANHSSTARREEWDSDALLLSAIRYHAPFSDVSFTDSSYRPSPRSKPRSDSPVPMVDQDDWFRVQYGYEDSMYCNEQLFSPEARAKHEWVLPEHLPTSPLCPLHVKYKGANKGVCVYHGIEEDQVTGSEKKMKTMDTPVEERVGSLSKVKSRRLASLSGP
ncbi:hypothetical protein BU24DRAFT_459108 [Aaosphaeria arxii CBS 175.79]|uniref:Uncharacterized protein n=1 Tax=Aaosphaeria arxii CBS 175.79 TaxID=1450172 RepID=A0A6A5Y1J8_9PLEO|nr:uncharacterized protein BU24DRAFT_459108 [Aaosphaeria arxii CBS 175.79]KAF2019435.1 hypothetical protein BU24DRAFT_459108 [Aaosphaeria arxii CBS 175.79]